jgi:hypothetical protein
MRKWRPHPCSAAASAPARSAAKSTSCLSYYWSVKHLQSKNLLLLPVLRIRDDFIPDPAKFHSGSRILLGMKEKGTTF